MGPRYALVGTETFCIHRRRLMLADLHHGMDSRDAMRVLITGATGTLGSALCSAVRRFGHDVLGVSRTKPPGFKECAWRPLDVRDGEAVDRLITEVRPDLVLNSAAVVGDWEVTASGAVNVAIACAERGVRQLMMSTDAVFAGRDEGYKEGEPPSPVTPYGAAKAAAETAVSTIDPTAAIVRTSLIIGSDGDTPRDHAVHEAVADPGSRAFYTDEIRSPVSRDDLVTAVWEVATSGRSGVHHVAGPEPLSQYELAVLIARRDGLDPGRLRGVLRGSRPGAAVIRLDCTAAQAVLQTRLRAASEFLAPNAT